MKDNLDIIKADTIEQYNKFFGFETRHPLVSIVHFDQSVPQPTHKMTLGFYALFHKNSAKICRIAKNERFTSVSPQ